MRERREGKKSFVLGYFGLFSLSPIYIYIYIRGGKKKKIE